LKRIPIILRNTEKVEYYASFEAAREAAEIYNFIIKLLLSNKSPIEFKYHNKIIISLAAKSEISMRTQCIGYIFIIINKN
jgi:hypothetical protein